MHRTAVFATLLAAALAACSSSTTAPKLLGRDPYVIVELDREFVTSRLNIRYQTAYLNSVGSVSIQGTTQPGEWGRCLLFGGLTEDSVRGVEIRVAGDSLVPNQPDTVLNRALVRPDTTWTGLVRLSTGTFDASLSPDTSRGHGGQPGGLDGWTKEKRPIIWHWYWRDSGLVLSNQDTTTVCN